MPIPDEPISISIADDTYTEIESGDEGPELVTRRFGDAYGGTFSLRHRTLEDQAAIDVALSIRYAGGDLNAIPLRDYRIQKALATVERTKLKVPEWWDPKRLGSVADEEAVLKVLERYEQALNDAKKKPTEVSRRSLTTG